MQPGGWVGARQGVGDLAGPRLGKEPETGSYVLRLPQWWVLAWRRQGAHVNTVTTDLGQGEKKERRGPK